MKRKDHSNLKKKSNNKETQARTVDVLSWLNDQKIDDGDLVALNVDQIMRRKDYSRMHGEYRQFVENARGKVFVAHSYRAQSDGFSVLLELEGAEKWLFWYGDLLLVKNKGVK